jgi:hypothetical protein
VTGVTLTRVLAAQTQSPVLRKGGACVPFTRGQARLVAAAVVPLLASGCLLNTKTGEGRALHNAPQALARGRSVAMSLTVSSRLVKPGSLVTLPMPDPGLHLDGVLDPATGLATYTASGRTVAVYDRKRIYALRPHASPTDARPWIQVSIDKDLKDRVLDPAALPTSLAALVLRPLVLVDALSGALTGSIQKHGTQDVDGTPTTAYTARFDLTQALAEAKRHRYSQREQDDLAHLMDVLGMKTDEINDGAVWLDSSGAPRRIALALRESPAPESRILLNIDLRLRPQAETVAIHVPDGNAVTTVPSLFQFLQPLKPGSGA